MEEKKEKKKINKKALLVLFTLAIVFAIIGFIDLKSNAAENQYSASIEVHFEKIKDGKLDERSEIYSWVSDSPIQVYLLNRFEVPIGEMAIYNAFVVSESPLVRANGDNYSVEFVDSNGKTLYFDVRGANMMSSLDYDEFYVYMTTSSNNVILLNQVYDRSNFASHYVNGTFDIVVNYDNLEIDDDMPVPINLKRNVIRNDEVDKLIANALATDIYDYITWTNTDDKFRIQLQTVPVVQYYKLNLNRNKLVKEYYGKWKTQEIYTDVSNSYLLCTLSTDLERLYSNSAYADGFKFKSECNEKYQKDFLEENYLYFGYRIRYVDVENNKASNWVVLVPSDEFDSYKTYIEYSDGLAGDSSSGNGLYNEYENLEDVEDAKKDVETENVFKDKYQVVDGNADTQEVMNWLNTVVSFIKGTPDLVTEVLSFLPQPILYGMYITIFLGVIASAIAIIKALI